MDGEELEEEEMEELEEKLEMDYQLGEDFKEKVRPDTDWPQPITAIMFDSLHPPPQ